MHLRLALSVVVLGSCSEPAAPHASAGALAAGKLEYPAARRADLVEEQHGVRVADPYRWLEDLDSAETRAWLDAQRALSNRVMSSVPGRARVAAGLEQAFDFERVSPPEQRGQRSFFSRNAGLQDQAILYVTDAADAEPRVLMDPTEISPDGSLAFVGFRVSPQGTYVAYGLSIGGGDWTEWRVRDTATGADLPDRAEWTKYYAPDWSADEKGFFYSAFPRPAQGQELTAVDRDCKVKYHALGAPAAQDSVVFERSDQPTWQFEPQVSEDGRWLVVTVGDGQVGDRGVEAIHLLDLTARGARPFPLVDGFDAEYRYVGSEGSVFYLQTTQAAPKRRLIAVDAADPKRAAWRTVVAEGEPIDAAVRAGDRLFVATRVDASSRLHAFGLDGAPRGEVQLPGVGSAYPVAGRSDAAQLTYVFTSFIAPATVYRYDFASGHSEPFRAARGLLDPQAYEVKEVFYSSADGTRVPMFVAHRRGIALDGTHPALLTGYGGFGVSIGPHYNPTQAWWLSIGGVLAEPCLRGGAEYGDAWHQAAIKTKKQTTFDDFIAAAEWLSANGYTSPKKLMISGASNGGLLIGAVVTQRPELFGAAVAQVGVLDMLRFHRVGQGQGWQGDYGSPDVAEEFRALLAYSPLHNVHSGTVYPPLLAVTGDHDTRVAPWHSFKFIAALQAAQAGPAPILLQLETTAGHGGGTTIRSRLQSTADTYAFALDMLGVPLSPTAAQAR